MLAAGGLLAVAVLAAGIGLPRTNAQAPDKKADPKKVDPRNDPRGVDPQVGQNENDLLLDYFTKPAWLLNDIRRDNFENPYGIYRPRQPPVLVESACLPTPIGASVERLTPVLADQLNLKAGIAWLSAQ